MAKYKVERYQVPKTNGLVVEFQTYIDKKTNDFYIDIDEKYCHAMDKEELEIQRFRNADYEALKRKYHNLIFEFYDASITSKKIIKYVLNYQAIDPTQENYTSIKNMREDNFFGRILNNSIMFEFKVMYLISVGENKFLSDYDVVPGSRVFSGNRSGDSLDRMDSKYRIADHTEALEQFFTDFQQHIYELCKRAALFFGEEPEDLIKSLNSGIKLIGEK